jgi:hypothetical protein
MIKGKINNRNGETLATFGIPETLYELPLNRYVDFIVEMNQRDDEGKNAISCISKAVSAFFGIDLDAVMKAQYTAESENMEVETAHIMAIKQLHGYAAMIIDKHLGNQTLNPKISVEIQDFDFLNDTYHLSPIGVRALSNGALETVFPPLSTIECIEGAEIQRVSETLIQEDGDPDGNHIFAKLLKLIAVFARLSGEVLPNDDREREQFILSRADHFGGSNAKNKIISAGTALDIDFFLTPFSVRYKEIPIVVSFLFHQSLGIVLEARLKASQQMQGQKRMQRRMGKKSLNGLGGGGSSQRLSKRAILRKAARAKQN